MKKSFRKAEKKSADNGRVNGHAIDWNNPKTELRVGDEFYVDLVNALVTSFFGPDSLQLADLESLNPFMEAYNALAHQARTLGDVSGYYKYNQVASLLKKLELTRFEKQARARAVDKWLSAEAGCKEMNEKCLEILRHPLSHSQPELGCALDKVRREIYDLLGTSVPSLDSVAHFMRFGPGTTLSNDEKHKSSLWKLQSLSAYETMRQHTQWFLENTGMGFEVAVSSSFEEDFGDLSERDPRIEYFDYAKLAFVPKSTAELRSIEIGPSLAIFFQSGYDGVIRQRLRSEWGIDLSNQEPNRRLAYEGSVAGEKNNSPCTIDLSSASDTLAYGIVALLLPSEWVRAMLPLRAKYILVGEEGKTLGTFHKLEKFSSMGNSLTFSLQTLIYAAVVRSVLRERGFEGSRWRVYGDDIIVPRRCYDSVVKRLETLGFTVNSAKSFSVGNFRESCGADYLHGTNVRPLYIKKPISSIACVYKYLNLVQRFAHRAPIPASYYRAVYMMLYQLVPRELRLFGDTRHAIDSCIWAPRNRWLKGSPTLVRLQRKQQVPGKLAYIASLLLGYEPPSANIRMNTCVGPFGPLPKGTWFDADILRMFCTSGTLRDDMRGVMMHSLPSYERDGGFKIRRSPAKGLVTFDMSPEDLPFDPYLG